MELNLFTWWLCLAILLIIAEIVTTTVYLLFISITCFIVATLAWFHAPFILQVICASVLSLLSVYGVNKYKAMQKSKNINGKNILENINNFDIGQVVYVEEWKHNSSRVMYKGTYWQAQFRATERQDKPVAGEYIIVDMQANVLLLEYKS
ncbi:MAG: hypothetical protein RLZZ210_560 [Pseudomonadota bacterium]